MNRLSVLAALATSLPLSAIAAEEIPSTSKPLFEMATRCRIQFKAVRYFELLPERADELEEADLAYGAVALRESRDGLGQSKETTQARVRELTVAWWTPFATREGRLEADAAEREEIVRGAERCLAQTKQVGARALSLARYRSALRCQAASRPLVSAAEPPELGDGLSSDTIESLARYSAAALTQERQNLNYDEAMIRSALNAAHRELWSDLLNARPDPKALRARIGPVLRQCAKTARLEGALGAGD